MNSVMERLDYLESRFGRINVHETYFNNLDIWLSRQFGVNIFPKAANEVRVPKPIDDADNPFLEVEQLRQQVTSMEAKLSKLENRVALVGQYGSVGMGGTNARPAARAPVRGKKSSAKFSMSRSKAAAVAAEVAHALRSKASGQGSRASSAFSPGTGTTPQKAQSNSIQKAILTTPPKQNNGIASTNSTPNSNSKRKSMDDAEGSDNLNNENIDENIENVVIKKEVEIPDDAVEETEELTQEMVEDDEDIDEQNLSGLEATYTIDEEGNIHMTDDGKMDEGDEKMEETMGEDGSVAAAEKPAVTYTTRGRRHIIPRRYAEFTGHGNVVSILKKQRHSKLSKPKAMKQVAKAIVQKKMKLPKLPKVPSTSVSSSGSGGELPAPRPACVRDLVTCVLSKDVDIEGDIILSDTFPDVRVNQQQLLNIIYRSAGKSTRLTRKLTTLIFDDNILASASPFGTKYYKARLPPEPLEAIVDFIMTSGCEPQYTKKKIYMIIGQVCNEARAGRVKKLVPMSLPSDVEDYV